MLISPALLSGASEDHLVKRSDGHRLENDTNSAFERMQKAALAEGIDLQVVSSFRSLDRQLAIWNAKWRGERTLYSLHGEVLDPNRLNDEEKLEAILTWSALPGSSRHHWGTDLDVMDKQAVVDSGKTFELVPEEYAKGGPCYNLSCWLTEHSETFGFGLPYKTYTGGVAAEPWHLSYTPVSSKLNQHITHELLHQVIESLKIDGKPTVLKALPIILERYIVRD
jgi:LAS superfamily LD-carboxypeptidase LdcB